MANEQSTKQWKIESIRWKRNVPVSKYWWMWTCRNEGNYYHYYYHKTHRTSDIRTSLDSFIIDKRFLLESFTHESFLETWWTDTNDL